MSRHERATYICQRLAARIGREVPEGTGRRPEVWEAVEAPSRRFLQLLDDYETGPLEEAVLTSAGVELLDAWRKAAA